MADMLNFEQAQARLAQAGTPIHTIETVALAHAGGRVLAHAVDATVDMPAADNSAMDGYAIRVADFRAGEALPIQQRIYAGEAPLALTPGHAARLFTGSLMPEGADAVVMQEDTEALEGDKVLIHDCPPLGNHVRKRGEDTLAGTRILEPGTVLGAGHIGLLASQGYAQVQVFAKLRVGILTTGDELVEPGQPRADHQIFNSNAAMLAELVRGIGADVHRIAHAQDGLPETQAKLGQLLEHCDIVISTGGVSVGERDFIKPALEALGATLDLWRVRMKPGKPVALAHVNGKPVIGLPGNPVSSFAVFMVLVTPLIRRMQGRADIMPRVEILPLRTQRRWNDTREEFLRVRCEADPQFGASLSTHNNQGSGMISALAWSDGLARIPPLGDVGDGQQVRYYAFANWLH